MPAPPDASPLAVMPVLGCVIALIRRRRAFPPPPYYYHLSVGPRFRVRQCPVPRPLTDLPPTAGSTSPHGPGRSSCRPCNALRRV